MVTAGPASARLLSGADVRELAVRLGVRPTKRLGQNFVVDPNTVRRIVRLAQVGPADTVLEVGPGLGSLTLALADIGARVVAVEVDPVLAHELSATIADRAPDAAARVSVHCADALRLTELPGPEPTALVANLPYNISVPVVLHVLQSYPTVRRALVMVQLEVAQRLAAGPGSKTYGAPSVKAAWFGQVRLVGTVPRTVFWPVPNVDSGLVEIVRRDAPPAADGPSRAEVFQCVDAAFAQRRKTLRAALTGWAGSGDAAQDVIRAAGLDPRTRGEQLSVDDFVRLAQTRRQHPAGTAREVSADVGA